MKEAAAPESLNRTIQEGSTEWTLRNYSRCRRSRLKKEIESNEFNVGHRRWTICLYLGGNSLESHWSGYSSLFLRCKNGGSVWFLYELYLVDQSGKGNHLGFSFIGDDDTNSGGINIPGRGYTVGKYFFVRRTVMESRDYLKDDCVRFRCRIVVLTRQAQAPLIEDGVAQLSKRNPRADVLIQVGNDKVFAHKWLLAASSPVLCSRLSDPLHFSKGLFVIPDVEPVLFKTMLHFMYTGKLEEDGEEFVSYAGPFVLDLFIGKVLAAAYQFKMEKLKKCCESRILSKLSVKSVAYLLHLADVCCAAELKAACLRFAAENLDAVLDSEGCKYLRKSCPSLYEDLAPRGILGWEFRVTSKILSAIEPFVGLMTTLLLEAIPEE